MSKSEKSIDEQIIDLVNEFKQITIKQIAQRLDRDLGQISKRIKILEQKQIVKKIEYSPTGSKSHSKMITFTEGYIPENSPVGQVPNLKVNLMSQLDKVNLSSEDNLMSQLDIDKLNSIPDDLDLDLEMDLSDNDFSGKKVEKDQQNKLDEQIELLKNRIEQLENQTKLSEKSEIPNSIRRKLVRILQSQKSRFQKSANPKSPGMYEMIHDIVEFFDLDLKMKLD